MRKHHAVLTLKHRGDSDTRDARNQCCSFFHATNQLPV